MIESIRDKKCVKFSFGKGSEFLKIFSANVGAYCMYDDGYGFSIPQYPSLENILRAIFFNVVKYDGIFLFNISGVDIKRAMQGFSNFEEAFDNNFITEWELFIIINDEEYLSKTVFHNGVNEFVLTREDVRIRWN